MYDNALHEQRLDDLYMMFCLLHGWKKTSSLEFTTGDGDSIRYTLRILHFRYRAIRSCCFNFRNLRDSYYKDKFIQQNADVDALLEKVYKKKEPRKESSECSLLLSILKILFSCFFINHDNIFIHKLSTK